VEIFLQLVVAGLAMGSIYGLVALGFVLLVNAANIINFAQGEFVMVGAFLVFSFTTLWKIPFPLSVVLAVVVMALFGILVERVAYRPLRNTNVVTIIVSTLGISVFLQNAALLIWGAVPEPFTEPFGRQMWAVGGVRLVPQYILILGATCALVVLQHLFFHRTRTGKMMRAAAQDRDMAQILGIDISQVTALTFSLAAALGGLAGILVAPIFSISVVMGVMLGLKAFVASIIGGWGSIPGALVGGITLGLIETLGAAYISSLYKDVFAFLVLIVFLIVLPRGIFGEAVAEKV